MFFHFRPLLFSFSLITRRELVLDLEDRDFSTAIQKTQLIERRGRLERLLARLRQYQKTYTPLALSALSSTPDHTSVTIESTSLLLPSSLPDNLRLHPDMSRWIKMELDF
jgi:hypothetical protein